MPPVAMWIGSCTAAPNVSHGVAWSCAPSTAEGLNRLVPAISPSASNSGSSGAQGISDGQAENTVRAEKWTTMSWMPAPTESLSFTRHATATSAMARTVWWMSTSA